MTRKRKSHHFYSARHKRRLIRQATLSSVSTICQAILLEQANSSQHTESNAIEQAATVSSSENVDLNIITPDIEGTQMSKVEKTQDDNMESSMDTENDTKIDNSSHDNISISDDSYIKANVEAHGHENAHNIVNVTEACYDSNHSNDSYDSMHSDDSNDSKESQESIDSDDLFLKEFRQWICSYKPPRGSLNALLDILRKHVNTKLPKDYRALLKTPRSTEIHFTAGGQYWHNGLEKVVKSIIQKRLQVGDDNRKIDLLINIDGAPIGKSSQNSLWPILCSDNVSKEVYIVGAFFGEGKPNDANQFLDLFINEAVTLVGNGVLFDNEQFVVRIQGFICDAPAKAFILQVKNFNGYNSCTKCTIEGEYTDHTMCFPSAGRNITLRTDENFSNYVYQDDYQTARTNLTKIPHLGLVSNVLLDYMHLICLGIVRKLIMLWLHGPLSVRLSAYDINRISRALVNISQCLPSDFVRKPRSLKYVKLWKATEYRQFLLYLGPIVLKNVLKESVYEHFLILHAAVTILVSPILARHPPNVDYAEQLLQHFVELFGEIYGVKYMSHNVHNLLHLAEDVRKFGPLDEFSAFRFENHMSAIIKLTRKGERPLQQIARRLAEYEYLSVGNTKKKDAREAMEFQKLHFEGPLISEIEKGKQYKIMRQCSYYINCKDPKNNCCMLKNGVMIECANFVKCQKTTHVVGYELIWVEDVYSLPCESQTFNIRIVKRNAIRKSWRCDNICLKLMKIPLEHVTTCHGGKIAVLPILHTSANHSA